MTTSTLDSTGAGHPSRRDFLALAGAATLGLRATVAGPTPMAAPVDPTADSALRLADAIRRREISSVDLLDALLARIHAVICDQRRGAARPRAGAGRGEVRRPRAGPSGSTAPRRARHHQGFLRHGRHHLDGRQPGAAGPTSPRRTRRSWRGSGARVPSSSARPTRPSSPREPRPRKRGVRQDQQSV